MNDWNRATEARGLGIPKDDSSQDSSAMKDAKPESSMVGGNELGIVSISSSPIPSSSVSCCVGRDSRYGREEGFFQCHPFVMHNRFQRVWSSASERQR